MKFNQFTHVIAIFFVSQLTFSATNEAPIQLTNNDFACKTTAFGEYTNITFSDLSAEEAAKYGFSTPIKMRSYRIKGNMEYTQWPWFGGNSSVKYKIVILKNGILIINKDYSGPFREELKDSRPGDVLSIIVGHYEGGNLIPNILKTPSPSSQMVFDKCQFSLILGSDDNLGDDRAWDNDDAYLTIHTQVWFH